MVCGDWNAVSGKRLETDEARAIGDYGISARNASGSGFVHWAISERMSQLNTRFDKDFSQQWTYEKGNVQRQIDYACIDVSKAALVKDAEASDDITLGLDHRGKKKYSKCLAGVLRFRENKLGPQSTDNWKIMRNISMAWRYEG